MIEFFKKASEYAENLMKMAGRADLPPRRVNRTVEGGRRKEDVARAAHSKVSRAIASGQPINPEDWKQAKKLPFMDWPSGGVLENKASHERFMRSPKGRGEHGGYWVVLDMNDLRLHNEVNHTSGDEAIATTVNNLFHAAHESLGRRRVRGFRTGGDEFAFFVDAPDKTHAQFYSALRKRFGALPKLNGLNLSMSVGSGRTYHEGDSSAMLAKENKRAGGHQPGQAPSYFHSNLPGFEGHTPQDTHSIVHPSHDFGSTTPTSTPGTMTTTGPTVKY